MNAAMEKSTFLREFPERSQEERSGIYELPVSMDGSPYRGLYVESRGFDTFLYRTEPLTVIDEFQMVDEDDLKEQTGRSQRPIHPLAFDLSSAPSNALPQTILKSDDMKISVFKPRLRCKNYGLRNGDGNEIFFAHKGSGEIYTDYGVVSYDTGDYVFIPKGATYLVYASESTLMLIAEIPKRVFLPRHYWLSDFFPLDSSVIEEAHIICGEDVVNVSKKGFPVLYKVDGAYSVKLKYRFSPFNCVGWRGKMYPFKLSTENIHTLVSPTMHLPPTAFVIFVTEDLSALVSTFLPRWIHSLPYNHMNDHDEFLFYHYGDYGARTGMECGDATLHPSGLHHGPQPDKMKAWEVPNPGDLPWRDEVAIMLESQAPLRVTSVGMNMRKKGYHMSWANEWGVINDK